MSIWKYIGRRALEYLITWYVAVSLAFILPHLLPIDPVKLMIQRLISTASSSGGGGIVVTSQAMQELAHRLEVMFGVDKPLYMQYLLFIWNALHLNFGVSIWLLGTPVSQIILRVLPYDIILLVPAVILSWYVGNKLGAYLGFDKRGTKTDKASLPALYALNNAPYFWFALLLMMIFASYLHIFPPTGTPYSQLPSLTWSYVSDLLWHMALPFLSLFAVSLGGWAIGMRQNMLNEVRSNYAVYGEALGLTKGVLRRYTYHNAILPQITGLAINLGYIVAGNAVLEFTFQYPGIGMILGNAIYNYDYFLMQGIFFFVVTMVLIANFIIEVVYTVIDPRIRASVSA
ncbi:MAG: ABC transporter permease [Thermoproteus sp.]